LCQKYKNSALSFVFKAFFRGFCAGAQMRVRVSARQTNQAFQLQSELARARRAQANDSICPVAPLPSDLRARLAFLLEPTAERWTRVAPGNGRYLSSLSAQWIWV